MATGYLASSLELSDERLPCSDSQGRSTRRPFLPPLAPSRRGPAPSRSRAFSACSSATVGAPAKVGMPAPGRHHPVRQGSFGNAQSLSGFRLRQPLLEHPLDRLGPEVRCVCRIRFDRLIDLSWRQARVHESRATLVQQQRCGQSRSLDVAALRRRSKRGQGHSALQLLRYCFAPRRPIGLLNDLPFTDP